MTMIVLGIILLLIGYFTGLSILYTIGGILVVIGVVLWILGAVGRPVGGRKVWFSRSPSHTIAMNPPRIRPECAARRWGTKSGVRAAYSARSWRPRRWLGSLAGTRARWVSDDPGPACPGGERPVECKRTR
jgi:hypothetical protein